MRLNKRYKPLFKLKTRYCIITGGRGSGKSFALSVRLLFKTYEPDKTILFSRYTMTSAEISIIPEFWEKVEILGLENDFTKTANSVINNTTGSTILFRGLKASSGNQTANLKSINNITTWVLDEAEEMKDESMFDKIDLSVRKKGEANEIIIVLNPPDKSHMIFKKFFKTNGLTDVHNGVVNNCTFIHTTYLDNISHLDNSFIQLAEQVKGVDIDKYNNVFLGSFSTQAKGLIYKGWTKGVFPSHLDCWFGVDWGFSNDPTAVVLICYDKLINTLYLKEVLYERGKLNNEIAASIKNAYRNKETLVYEFEDEKVICENSTIIATKGEYKEVIPLIDFLTNNNLSENFEGRDIVAKSALSLYNILTEIYCDPARPEHIKEMRTFYGLSTVPAINAKKVERIEFLKYFNVVYDGENIEREVENYKWIEKKNKNDNGEIELENEPQDGNDHLMDAINYGAVTHLRRLGISNLMGNK